MGMHRAAAKGYPGISEGIPWLARIQRVIARALAERDAELAMLAGRVRRLEMQVAAGSRRDDDMEVRWHELTQMMRRSLLEMGVEMPSPDADTRPNLRAYRGGRAS